jgi:preprotein translocase subunit SecG
VHTIVTIIHIIACVVLILVVLLQAGKGANMGAAFGGASQTVFGSSGAGTFLGKMTTLVAAVFMLTSLGLSYFAGESVMNSISRPEGKKSAPQMPILPAGAEKAKETNPSSTMPGAK